MNRFDCINSSLSEKNEGNLTMSCSEKAEKFLPLIKANQTKIHAYILSLVPNFNDAEEILQETVYIMWKKFDQFEIGSSFDAWAVRIAHYNILSYRKKNKKEVCFSESIFGQIRDIAEKKYALADDRIDALRCSIGKLNEDDKSLLRRRFEFNDSVKNMSNVMNRSSKFIYKRLAQILDALHGSMKIIMQENAIRDKGGQTGRKSS